MITLLLTTIVCACRNNRTDIQATVQWDGSHGLGQHERGRLHVESGNQA